MVEFSMKQLLEAGVHFGHQTQRWNPKMKPYIFSARNGIHIINLEKTVPMLRQALDFVSETVSKGKDVLMVGTKKQAQEIIREEATRAGMHFITYRWLGGTLTNFKTIKSSLERLKKIETMKEDGTFELLSKKEVSRLEKEKSKLDKNLGGIRNMKRPPGVVFVVDPNKESIAVKEARKLGIPLVGIVDTNCDPEMIDYPIPGNDDAIKSIKVCTSLIVDSVLEGIANRQEGIVTVAEGEELEEIGVEVEKAEGPLYEEIVESYAEEEPETQEEARDEEKRTNEK